MVPSASVVFFFLPLLGSVVHAFEVNGVDCPGVFNINNGNSACCVGGTIAPLQLSTCAGWPICTGPVTTTTTSTPISCATIIPYPTSDYSSLISSADSSMSASGTHFQTTLGDSPITAAPSTETASSGTTTPSSAGSKSGSASSSTSTGGAHGLTIGAMGIVGGALLAVAAMLYI